MIQPLACHLLCSSTPQAQDVTILATYSRVFFRDPSSTWFQLRRGQPSLLDGLSRLNPEPSSQMPLLIASLRCVQSATKPKSTNYPPSNLMLQPSQWEEPPIHRLVQLTRTTVSRASAWLQPLPACTERVRKNKRGCELQRASLDPEIWDHDPIPNDLTPNTNTLKS